MENFAKSVLNYYATFNETRFNFSKKIPYEWTNNSLTLDLSLFPEFHQEMLGYISSGNPVSTKIAEGDYTIEIDEAKFRRQVIDSIGEEYNQEYLKDCIQRQKEKLAETGPTQTIAVDEDGMAQEPVSNTSIEEKAEREGLRDYNLAFRKHIRKILQKIQQKRQEDLEVELGISSFPPSSFNPKHEEQKLYDGLQRIAYSAGKEEYLTKAAEFIEELDLDFVMYDLFLILRRFETQIGINSLYLYFNEISNSEYSFPLFCLETDMIIDEKSLKLASVRDVIMLNTPAINFFEFDSVLTTPRASHFADVMPQLKTIEAFLQNKYKVRQDFILDTDYAPISGEEMPEIRSRIGFQVVGNEDRKILDYSELITDIGQGAGKKFIEMISTYVNGNVKNNSESVGKNYRETFPPRSGNNLLASNFSIPLSLNESQRKILTAVEDPKNRTVVIDGPPGTGKSYTITAIVYLANMMGKSAVVTSHKKQALDIIDETLTEQFKELHPKAKPPVVRFGYRRGADKINGVENTLSSNVVSAAERRLENLNTDAVKKDKCTLEKRIASETNSCWKEFEGYPDEIDKSYQLFKLLKDLGIQPEQGLPRRIPDSKHFDFEQLLNSLDIFSSLDKSLSLYTLAELANRGNHKIEVALERLEELDRQDTSDLEQYSESAGMLPPEADEFHKMTDELLEVYDPAIEIFKITDEKIDLADAPPSVDKIGATTYSELEYITSIMSKIGDNMKGLFGRVRNKAEIKRLKGEMRSRTPAAATVLEELGYRKYSKLCSEIYDYINRKKELYPFLSNDYFLANHRDLDISESFAKLKELESLKYRTLVGMLESLLGSPLRTLSLGQIRDATKKLIDCRKYMQMQSSVEKFADILCCGKHDYEEIYRSLGATNALLEQLDEKTILSIQTLFDHYGSLLAVIGIDSRDMGTLPILKQETEKAGKVRDCLALHSELSKNSDITLPNKKELDDYLEKNRKLLERRTDKRLANLGNYSVDMEKIKLAVKKRKRISNAQARILLDNLACIIAEPKAISRHFPMEENMIDLLIIDEASQVSIAESLSLMLRAKQTIVFGDELQYGAVGAANVSKKYSGHYFKDILDDYAKDRHEEISEGEKQRIANEVSAQENEEDMESSRIYPVDEGTKEWLKTFSVRTSTLAFAKALNNYSNSLNVHFRSFPEIISYSNDFFYRQSQIDLAVNRIRTKPIADVLRFVKVETQGKAGQNVNLDEIEAIRADIKRLIENDYTGTLGIICSFKEQTARMEELLRSDLDNYTELERKHKLKVWFVGDVQGEERDLIYYSFVQDKKIGNAELRTIYPVIGGTADNIRRLKMQRLNVGFSRAKDTMVFVHSMPLNQYSDTRLGDALQHYRKIAESTQDIYVESEDVLESPAEKKLYRQIIQTPFFNENRDQLNLIAQFEIGKYIKEEFKRFIPGYRVDFLLTKADGGKEKSLIIEYDGVEFHTKNPDIVTKHNFNEEYLEYDTNRQLELESYGYSFLRINKFTLAPENENETEVDVLDRMLIDAFR